ncbi:MAG: site-specific DNA-methyltransferase [Candidatus Hermodarchaeota archaeon]
MPNLIWKGKKEELNLSDLNSDYKDSFQQIKYDISTTIDRYNPNLNEMDNEIIWNNLLICGENQQAMKLLLKDFSSKINLIYIDPPFATGGNFTYKIYIGEGNFNESTKAYSDTWKEGLETYLNFLYSRLILMKQLLSSNGSIYVHLDWHVSHYVKIILDEIFGSENFRNEIIWSYPAASVQTRRFFIRSYDVILFYSKSEDYVFNDDPNIYMEYSNRVKNALKRDDKGIFYYRGGSHNGKKLSQKVYVKEDGIFPRDVWNDIPYIRANTTEYQGFSTQKPERLMKRIILSSSNKKDLVADFFCGTGTSLIVAEKLGRRWIGCDIANHAIHITRKRLLDISKSNDLFSWKKNYNKSHQPFEVINLNRESGSYIIPENLLRDEVDDISNIKEAPSFDVELNVSNKEVYIELKDYSLPCINLISNKILDKVNSFYDLIDYWAIDFNHNNIFFKNNWYSFRTPKNRVIKLVSSPFNYRKSNQYQIQVKLINIFGQESNQKYLVDIN